MASGRSFLNVQEGQLLSLRFELQNVSSPLFGTTHECHRSSHKQQPLEASRVITSVMSTNKNSMHGTITGCIKEVGVIDTLPTPAAVTRSEPTERMPEDICLQSTFVDNITRHCVCLCRQCQCIGGSTSGVGTDHSDHAGSDPHMHHSHMVESELVGTSP